MIEPHPPTIASISDRGDNLDALDIDTSREDVFRPIFLSLDSRFRDPLEGAAGTVVPNTGTAAGNGFFGGDVVVTTYGTARSDIAGLAELEFAYVILDEAQAIKSKNAYCVASTGIGSRSETSGPPAP